MMQRLRQWALALRREVTLLWLAARDPRTPWAARLLAGCVAAYALSPIDLIPDFIPVLGLLDDLVLLPAGIWLSLRLIPADLRQELRQAAATASLPGPAMLAAAAMVAIWLAAVIAAGCLLFGRA